LVRLRICSLALLTALLACFALAPGASAKTAFRPKVGRAMGLMPTVRDQDVATGEAIPVVYHGGQVMSDVTVHTIFWAPAGYQFAGSPGNGVPGYEPMIQQFFTDVAHESGSDTNMFSLLNQYKDAAGAGGYDINYDAAADTINDTDPYPAKSKQCVSPSGVATCVTDQQLTTEVDHIIQQHDPSGYGLHDLWQVYLPAGVDECSGAGTCGTNAFAAYHSEANAGHGQFIYAVIIDTLIEEQLLPGGDPEGNPEAEASIDSVAHETMEAMTNPVGNGWMDPNGFEVADKCEDGPQIGTPIGYAPDGAPYDQVINGHDYDIQEIWSNQLLGCMQSSTVTTSTLPIPSISLRQFSPRVSGAISSAYGPNVEVGVEMLRGLTPVAAAIGKTRANGSWGPITLKGPHGALHAAGDDRDAILVEYGKGGPKSDLILPGAGGNPFTEAGWTSWLDLDTGIAVASRSVTVGPCGQTGDLTVTIDGVPNTSLDSECQTETDQTTLSTTRITEASTVTLSSEDNRAVSALAPNGALVTMTVPVGEPGSIGTIGNGNVFFAPTGIPECTADLRFQVATCDGLVPGERYTLTRARRHSAERARADFFGTATFPAFPGARPIDGGDVLTLTNGARRVLTRLHVAHLRIAIDGAQTVVASGRCQPGDYFGAPLTHEPASSQIGEGGAAGTGIICPLDGHAEGLPDATLEQTDDLSGGQTKTSIPSLVGTAPSNDAIVYGPFTAVAQTGITGSTGQVFSTGAPVSLTITRAGSHTSLFHAADVAGATGASVPKLAAGVYSAKWVVSDRNGDTRTVKTTFVEAG
jgi:hypothetical protein